MREFPDAVRVALLQLPMNVTITRTDGPIQCAHEDNDQVWFYVEGDTLIVAIPKPPLQEAIRIIGGVHATGSAVAIGRMTGGTINVSGNRVRHTTDELTIKPLHLITLKAPEGTCVEVLGCSGIVTIDGVGGEVQTQRSPNVIVDGNSI